MSTARNFVDALPDNAIQCNGPLLYSLEHWVTPNGDFFKVNSTRKIIKLKACGPGKQYYSWAAAKQLLDNGDTIPMNSIEGIYVSNKGAERVLIRALVCYYFVEKKENLNNMRATLIDTNIGIIPENLHWVTAENQRNELASKQRSMVNPENICKIVEEPEDLNTEYIQWNDYYIKKDGTRVLKVNRNNAFKEIAIGTGGDGYKYVMIHTDGKHQQIRMNRLMIKATSGNIDGGKVVDHIDGDITNDSIDNLEVVSNKENSIRGKNSTKIFKVNPQTKEIIESIRCIREYTDSMGDGWCPRALAQRIDTNEQYNEFLWFDESTQDKIYTITDNIISIMDRTGAIRVIRKKINTMLSNNTITESMFPMDCKLSSETLSLIESLDPRGVGDKNMVDDTNNAINTTYPCCKVLSYFGRGDCGQIVLCIRNMLAFIRSRDNLLLPDRKCPLCINCHSDTACRMKFYPDGPEASIPIYSYTAGRKTKTNPDPLLLQHSYLTWRDFMGEGYTNTVFKALRKSIFQASTGSTGARAKCRNLILSMYPPNNNHLDETNPNWILNRRLNCPAMIAMRNYTLEN